MDKEFYDAIARAVGKPTFDEAFMESVNNPVPLTDGAVALLKKYGLLEGEDADTEDAETEGPVVEEGGS